MKNKTKSVIIIIAIIILSTSTIQAETIKNEAEDKIAENIEEDEESSCLGCIYGSVGNSHGVYTWTTYPFALVTSGIKSTICGIGGGYSMFLSLNRVHCVTAHVVGFKPLTKYVHLTTDDPIQRVVFDMDGYEQESSESNPINKNLETANFLLKAFKNLPGIAPK